MAFKINLSKHTSTFSLVWKSQDLAKSKRTDWSSINKLSESHLSGAHSHFPQIKLI